MISILYKSHKFSFGGLLNSVGKLEKKLDFCILINLDGNKKT